MRGHRETAPWLVVGLLAILTTTSCSLQDFGRFTFGDDMGVVDMGPPAETRRLTVVLTGQGTVTSDPVGIDCSAANPGGCTFDFALGQGVTLTATPDANWRFLEWGRDCSGSVPCVIGMSEDRIVQAIFERATATVTVVLAGDGAGRVVSDDGMIDCSPGGIGMCTGTFPAGTVVTLTATASAGVFAGWSGHCAGASICALTVTKDFLVGASFDDQLRSVLVSRAGNGEGTITSSPSGVDCGMDCAEGYASGTAVTLTAVAAAGSIFAGWSGDCAGTSPICNVTLDRVRAVNGTFNLRRNTLTVEPTGTGMGTVESFPAGIDCGASCSADFDHGTMVTLVAAAETGSTFEAWSGAGGCSGTSTICNVILTSAATVFPIFALEEYDVTVTRFGSGTGTVLSEPIGIVCGSDCMEPYGYGTMVTLTAVPDPGSTFSGWTGGCTGTDFTCVVTITSATMVTAGFTQGSHPVSVTMTGSGTGTVTANQGAIDCGTACTADLAYGTVVTFTAAPMTGSSFAGWGGSCSGTSTTCMLTITQATTVSATFVPAGGSVLTVTKTGAGTGSISSNPVGIACGESCAASFTANTMVTLTVSPGPGSVFEGWSGGGCSGTGDCTVTVNGATEVTADFSLIDVTLTVARSGNGNGTVISVPTGVDCGADCTETVPFGTALTLTAMASPDSLFMGWSGGGCMGTGPCMAVVAQGTTISADFALRSFPVMITKGGTGTGTVSADIAGLNCGADCMEDVQAGTMVTFTAVPSPSSDFTGWSGGGCTGTGPCTVSVDATLTISASFALKSVALGVTKAGNGTGAVTSMPAGIDCGADCSEMLAYGTMVTLTATPDATSLFGGWSGACTGMAACVVNLSQATSVTATFTLRTYTVTVTRSGTGTGAVTSAPTGINCGATCSDAFDVGMIVTLTATPDASSTFAGWSGGGCTGTGTCDVTITAATTVTAMFALRSWSLTATKSGTGMGAVTSVPAGINCGAACSQTYTHGTMVTLTATPIAPGTFTGWSGGGCSGTGTCTVTLTAATTVTASFTLGANTLTVSRVGTGTGAVTSMPAGINCGADCTEDYFMVGTMVTLTAAADPSSTFAGWSGGGCTGTGPCMVTVSAVTNVTATFDVRTYTLSVMKSGTGDGAVTSMPAGINCGADCTETINHGTMVTLTAAEDAWSTFAGWSGGGCTGTGTCTVTVTAATAVTATFTANIVTLSLTKGGNATGTVTSMPAGINCGVDCSEGYAAGTTVTLTATADASSTFAGWSGGGCTGTGTCTVTVTAATTVTATFTLRRLTLSVMRAGAFQVTATNVTSSPAGITCGPACSAMYDYGAMVTLSASPGNGALFSGWSGGGCSGAGTCVVTLTADTTVTATFVPLYTVAVSLTGDGLGGLANNYVTSNPSGITCRPSGATGIDCSEVFPQGQSVTLTASGPAWAVFRSWVTGPCAGSTSTTCTFTVTNDTTLEARFDRTSNLVFVTSMTMMGNFGGLAGGDSTCAGRAAGQNLPGTYVAWLSTNNSSAANRICGGNCATQGPNGWVKLNGQIVANDWDDLTDGSLDSAINVTEANAIVAGVDTWTATRANGSYVGLGGGDCNNWGNGLATFLGRIGVTAIMGAWTDSSSKLCSLSARLYCFGTDLNRPPP